MTALYERQQALELTIPESVTVVGLGGIGFWASVYLAMSGVTNLYLFDADVIEESNRNRLPICQGSVGLPKVQVVKDYILAIRPDCNCVAIQEKMEGILLDIQVGISTVVLECTDSTKSQLLVYNACKKAGVSFVRAGYNGTHMSVLHHVPTWCKAEEDSEYTITPSWVVPASIVAALAVGKIMKYPMQSVGIDLSEIGVPLAEKNTKRLTSRCKQNQTSTIQTVRLRLRR